MNTSIFNVLQNSNSLINSSGSITTTTQSQRNSHVQVSKLTLAKEKKLVAELKKRCVDFILYILYLHLYIISSHIILF
jgi:hypothetical protein